MLFRWERCNQMTPVVRPFVDIVFSETVKWIDAKFYWQVPIPEA